MMASTILLKWARRCLTTEAVTAPTTTKAPDATHRLGSKILYLCDLSPSSQAHEIHRVFSRQGRVQSITMNFNRGGVFARTALVRFNSYEDTEAAMEEHRRNGTMLNGVQIQVTSTGASSNASSYTRPIKQGQGAQIFISNMSYTTTPEQIRAAFSSFGTVLNVNLFKRDNQSMGMAKVLFAHKADADAAIKALNEVSFDGRPLYVKMDSNYISTDDGGDDNKQQSSDAASDNVSEPVTPFDDDLMRSIESAATAPVHSDDASMDEAIRADNAALERELQRQPSSAA